MLNLRKEDINWENRAVVPNHFTKTKRSGITFFNKETEQWLLRYLETRDDQNPALFQISERQLKTIWDTASNESGTRITTKSLRLWHSVELGEKGMGDRYIDIFQGRAPRTTIAKHYTSHGVERLKVIYDKANPTILS